jgi:peptidoglycan/xylan/chitin deacetylase (PgdA/CDA1 family)
MEHDMKHRVRNFFVYLFTYTGITFLYRARMKQRGPLVRVIAFHDVDDALWFEGIISSLQRDFAICTPKEYVENIFDSDKINILITFDDGYASWVDVCLPILRKHNVSALFFINSGLLDVSKDEEKARAYVTHNLRLSPKKPLTWEGAHTLLQAGHEIGGHTVHHISLRGATEEVIRAEVEEDKRMIEGKLRVTLKHFAYPFGVSRDYSHETEKRIRAFGYTFVYIAEPGFLIQEGKHIPRTLVEKHQSYSNLRHWIHGSYDIFTYLKRSFGSSKESTKTY